MNIIIVGAGLVGRNLAKHFSELKHQISIIEPDKALCDSLDGKIDSLVVRGLGSSPEALETAGIKNADMVIAVTSSDEINMLVCAFAKQHGVAKRIARINSSIYTDKNACVSLNETGVTHVIEPEKEVMKTITQFVEMPNAIEAASFSENTIQLRGYKVTEDMPIANKSLIEINSLVKGKRILIVAIMRNGKNIPPVGSQIIEPGDQFVAIMHNNSLETFRQLTNSKQVRMKKVIVSGDTMVAVHVADTLRSLCDHVVLAVKKREFGIKAASLLEGVEVIQGDTTESEFLFDIASGRIDCFVAAGKDTEDNIMSCLLAKAEGAKHVIAVRDSYRHNELFRELGVDRIINFQELTLNAIIKEIQTVSLGSYVKLDTADVKMIRLKTFAKSKVAGKSLRELDKKFNKLIIIGCIMRGDEIIIPDGNTVVQDGDDVIIICHNSRVELVKKWFN